MQLLRAFVPPGENPRTLTKARRHRGFDSGNEGGNPVAAFDVDVSNDAIGDLGSPLGSANFVAVDIEFQFDLIGGVSKPAVCNSVVFSVRQENDTLVG